MRTLEIELRTLPALHPAAPARAASPSRSSTFSLSRHNSKESIFDDEPATLSRDPSPLRRMSVGERAPQLGQSELAPVDRGKGAMLFVAAAFCLELVIYGYAFTFGVVQVYLHSHPPFSSSSLVSSSPTFAAQSPPR